MQKQVLGQEREGMKNQKNPTTKAEGNQTFPRYTRRISKKNKKKERKRKAHARGVKKARVSSLKKKKKKHLVRQKNNKKTQWEGGQKAGEKNGRKKPSVRKSGHGHNAEKRAKKNNWGKRTTSRGSWSVKK